MKKFLIMMICSVAMLSSCKDFLNMPPKNTKVIYTIEDVKGAMSTFLRATVYESASSGYVSGNNVRFNGLYVMYPFHRYTNSFIAIYTNDIDLRHFYDPNWGGTSGRDGKPFESWYTENKNWEGYKFSATLWENAFTCVGYLNMLLKDLGNVPDYNKQDYEQIAGEAKLIRAWYLLRLNQLFAPFDKNEYGIPMNLDADVVQGGERWKQTDIYKTLLAEIEEVFNYDTPSNPTWNLFYNKRIIHGVLAQTYLYKAESCAGEPDDWSKAEYHAREARAGARVENTVEEQKELCVVPASTILERSHPFTLIRIANSYAAQYTYSPWGEAANPAQSATQDLLDLYDADDIRLPVYFTYKDNDERVYLTKMIRSAGINANYLLFRISNMLLIEAEALARQGEEQKAIALLNEFKSSKIPSYTSYTGSDVLGEILKERRKEFLFEEEHNWLDMKRNGVSVTRQAINAETLELETFTLESDDYRYALPIPPDSELRFNNIPQNPGWKY